MTKELLTVVTATVGDSWEHLNRSLEELRLHTNLPFRQIVSDDGTQDEQVKAHQREVVTGWGAEWTENPGPVYGLSYNLNHLLSLCKTPWVFILEDAVRPGKGWLESAFDALTKIGTRNWGAYTVAGIGLISSFDHWELEVAGLLPGNLGLPAYFGRCSHETARAFWASDWNDGLICWPRILPAVERACRAPEADAWPEILQKSWRQPILESALLRDEPRQALKMRWGESEWPKRRTVWPSQTPGPWTLLRKDAFEAVGRFRDGCCFYEGHLGVRLAQAGLLSVNIDCPPWLHYPSMAFHAIGHGGMAKLPRHLERDHDVFMHDFGCDGPDHYDLAQLVFSLYPEGVWQRLTDRLREVEIYMDPAWEVWSK